MLKLLVLVATGVLLGADLSFAEGLPESSGSTVGYATVNEALAALHARPDVKFIDQGGWTIADDNANKTLWSFAPQGYPAYPAAVKRQILESKDGIYIKMDILCQAEKAACDQLVLTFEKLNEAVKRQMSQRH